MPLILVHGIELKDGMQHEDGRWHIPTQCQIIILIWKPVIVSSPLEHTLVAHLNLPKSYSFYP